MTNFQLSRTDRKTTVDPSEQDFTEDELRRAVESSGRLALDVVIGLYYYRDLSIKSYFEAPNAYRASLKKRAAAALDRYLGIYRLLSPAGNVGQKDYRGLAAAETAAWFSNGSRIVMLVPGNTGPERKNPNGGNAMYFVREFPDPADKPLVDKLISLSLWRTRPDLNTRGWRSYYYDLACKRLATQRAIAQMAA